MHETIITYKNGKVISGYMNRFRPIEGWAEFDTTKGIKRVYFRDVKSMITKNERSSIINWCGDEDELERARELGWNGK